MAFQRGQYLRLFIKKSNTQQPIAMAVDMQMYVQVQMDNSSTKDDMQSWWDSNTPVSLSYNFKISALIGYLASGDTEAANTLKDLETNLTDNPVDWELAAVTGDNQRTILYSIATGKGKISNLQLVGVNKEKANFTCALNGYGEYTVGS